MNKDKTILKKSYKGISLKILFIAFFIFTINMASGYLKSNTISDTSNSKNNKTQLATPEMVVFGKNNRTTKEMSSQFRIPAAVISIYPDKVKKGQSVRVAWKSKGMENCIVSGPRGFYQENLKGAINTKPFRIETRMQGKTSAIYTLRCNTSSGRKVVRVATAQLQ